MAEDSMTQNQKSIKSLPKPRPGVVVKIPIDIWPEYMELYSLEVIGSKNGIVLAKSATKPAAEEALEHTKG